MAIVKSEIKFTQGITTDIPGNALFGNSGSLVICSNGDDTNVRRWTWILTDVPPGSGLSIGTDLAPSQDGPNPIFPFTPDVAGGYALKLIVWDESGKEASVSENVFGVKLPSGRFIPPFRARASMLKFSGQERGWSPYLEAFLLAMDAGGGGLELIDPGPSSIGVKTKLRIAPGINTGSSFPLFFDTSGDPNEGVLAFYPVGFSSWAVTGGAPGVIAIGVDAPRTLVVITTSDGVANDYEIQLPSLPNTEQRGWTVAIQDTTYGGGNVSFLVTPATGQKINNGAVAAQATFNGAGICVYLVFDGATWWQLKP